MKLLSGPRLSPPAICGRNAKCVGERLRHNVVQFFFFCRKKRHVLALILTTRKTSFKVDQAKNEVD